MNNAHTIETLAAKIAELEALLAAKPARKERDYGPKAIYAMDDLHAWRIMFGDLKNRKVREIADEFGFSRGQVYSVRGTYTFTHVTKDSFTMADVEKLTTASVIEKLEAEIANG